VLNTGVPHGVVFTSSVADCNVVEEGRKIRNDKQFPEGINVDFVERKSSDSILLRTYERGVEDETDACGTGAVAAAIASVVNFRPDTGNACDDKGYLKDFGMYEINVETKTAALKVYFTLAALDGGGVKDIILEGAAVKVFEGIYNYI
jgi:diaminopimelate epimerase